MLLTEQATRRLAQDLVANYGEDAASAASERAEAMEKMGNPEAAAVWAAVADMLARIRGRRKRADA